MEKGGYVYIMTNNARTVLYTGVTSDLLTRITEHRGRTNPKSFTSRYNIYTLVYYAYFDDIVDAIDEEKRIKGGSREAKESMIVGMNPEWRDLYAEVLLW
jgi:putative endonuclease